MDKLREALDELKAQRTELDRKINAIESVLEPQPEQKRRGRKKKEVEVPQQ